MLPDGTRTVRIEAASLDGPMVGKFVSAEKFERSLPVGLPPTSCWRPIWPGRRSSAGGGDWRRPALGDMVRGRTLRPGSPSPAPVTRSASSGRSPTWEARRCLICLRLLLAAQVARLAALGYDVRCAFELELFVLEESIGEARARGFKRLTPLGGHDPKPLYVMQRAPSTSR